MKKLDIKQLSPYLPYGINIKCNDGYVRTLCDKGGLCNISLSTVLDSDDIHEYKPILRPMDYLKSSKEVQVNLGLHTKVDIDFCIEDPTSMSYNDVKILLAYHYDIFGLISKGLALEYSNIN